MGGLVGHMVMGLGNVKYRGVKFTDRLKDCLLKKQSCVQGENRNGMISESGMDSG